MVSSHNLSTFTLLLLLGAGSQQATRDCISYYEDISGLDFPLESDCCKTDEWLVKSENGFRCVLNRCSGTFHVYYEGKCLDMYEDGACGDDLGKRLYLGEDGEVFCALVNILQKS